MSTIDLTTILGNISQSLLAVESLAAGLGYMVGILFVMSGVVKLTKVHKHSREKASTPVVYILGGTALIYLPSTLQIFTNTVFGQTNILQYTTYSAYSVYDAIRIMVQVSGVIWFVRGIVLLVHASEPGQQHGKKGMMFVLAGIIAVNFDYTVNAANTLFAHALSLSTKIF